MSTVIVTACCGAYLLFNVSGLGWKALAVPTGSMRPVMPIGTLVLVHRVPTASLKVGDVITYANPLKPKTTITHRIAQKLLIGGRISGFVTKGDANRASDIPIVAGSVEGRVIWHVPYVGFALLYAGKPWIILPVIYLAALPVLLEELRRLSDYYKLSQPYRLSGYTRELKRQGGRAGRRLALGAMLATFAMVVIGTVTAPTALAMLRTSTVSLAHNTLTVMQVLPTDVSQCKDGGWKAYGVFKNQGDCVSFVATHGKNPPAGQPMPTL